MSATRATGRRDPSPGRLMLIGAGTLGLLVLVLAVALRAPNGLPGAKHETFSVTMSDVSNLREHNDVRIAGVRVGQVLKISPSAGRAKLELQLSNTVGALPQDTTAAVRAAGLLGQRYLQLVPGRSATPLREGARIRAASTSVTLGIPEALQVFDTETRGALGKAITGLGTGVLGQGNDLNDAIRVSPQAATDFRTIAGAVTVDTGAARALLPGLDAAAGAVDRGKDDFAATFGPARTALQPFVDRRRAVQQTLAEAPPALAAAQPAFAESRRLLASARHLATSAARVLPRAPGALRATTALLREAHEPLRQATPLLTRTRTAVPATLKITRALAPVLGPLKKPLDDLLEPIGTIAAHRCDLTNFAQVWRSFLSYGVAGGGKIGPVGEIRAEALVVQPLAGAGDALKLPGKLVDRNPYPAPCAYGPSTYNLLIPTR